MAACSSVINGVVPMSPPSRTLFKIQTFSFLTHSKFLSSNSNLSLRSKFLLPKLQVSRLKRRDFHSVPIIVAAQSNFFRVIQTVLKVGKDGIEAGTNLVPETVPRPIARLSVTVAATALFLFVLRSFLSTVFFAMGVMGFVYFVYLALNKDKGPKIDGSSSSTDEAMEEARKIMEKYK